MDKTLYLQKRGCDFWKDETLLRSLSDVGNYRVVTWTCEDKKDKNYQTEYPIKGKDGNDYFIEFSNWERYTYRTTHKVTGKPLKHAIKELMNYNGLSMHTQYENENGCWGNVTLEKEISDMNLSYTLEDILKAVNYISVDNYTKIEFVD